MSEYVKHNKLIDSAKGLLVQGLRKPSLGTWKLFSRVFFKELQQDAYEWTFLQFPGDFEYLDQAINRDITNVIAFCNFYAQVATPDDAQCEIDIKKFEPFLNQLLDLKWLTNSSLEVRDGEVNISADSGALSLHPLLLYRKENRKPCFVFFNDIKNGSIALNDNKALPKEIDVYYKAILQRYAQDTDGDALLAVLYTFAAAKDYLTMSHLGLINKLDYVTLERIGSTLKEVLCENPMTDDVLDYQLFHESFREYLLKEKAKEISNAAEKIIEFCGTWKELEGSWEQRYALEHYATHLSESNKVKHHELLMELIYDRAYVAEQMKTLKSFDSSNRLYQLALIKACVLKKDDVAREAALCLVDIKYKEANGISQVLAKVANGDIDLALKGIESFGGLDEEGVTRKFILYMLCLMELTLMESKDKRFRKKAIKKMLHHNRIKMS
jgi:hypothetical protein